MLTHFFHTMSLPFHEIMHGLFAIPFVVLLYKKTRSLKLVFILFAVTYFVDLDHLVDYFMVRGTEFNLREFSTGVFFLLTDKRYEPFHAWEWLIILSVISYKRGWSSIFTAITLGLLPHFILDSLSVGSILFYSIIYRISKEFILFKLS